MVLSIVEVLPLQDLRGNAAVACFIQLLAKEEQIMYIHVKGTENSSENVYGV